MKKADLHILLVMLLAGAALCGNTALARNAMGKQYAPVSTVPPSQSQVIYYRADTGTPDGAAHVYVDGEFQTALLPGGYNAFCLTPGSHTLGSYINDAPAYAGKREQPWALTLEGGKTYFMRIDKGSAQQPEMVNRMQAEQELSSMHQQIHTLSRASSVVTCQTRTAQE
ncbi:hypothetical protein [Enterobacter sp. UNJFSC 003]|uniref:hypothetical protein n=1 Tax=Enterobacter sp. UNJFSC 003 TaxID=3122077 RepID=UPI002EB724E8|nr:hypothetical protein [Serratia liquefaciens]